MHLSNASDIYDNKLSFLVGGEGFTLGGKVNDTLIRLVIRFSGLNETHAKVCVWARCALENKEHWIPL